MKFKFSKLILLFSILFIFTCVKCKNKKGFKDSINRISFICMSDSINNKSIFPLMKNIDSMKDTNGNFYKKKYHIKNKKQYNYFLNTQSSPFLFDNNGLIEEYNIGINNDSLNIEAEGIKHTLAIFKYKYKFLLKSLNKVDTLDRDFFNFLDYSGQLDTIFFDKKCNDSIFKFNYYYEPPNGVSNKFLRNEIIKSIFISKTRGILEVNLLDRKENEIMKARYWNKNNVN